MSLTKRLLLGSLLVVSVLVVLVVVIVSQRLEDRLHDQLTRTLASEARLLAVQWGPEDDPDALADTVGAALERRVTLIAPDGRVVGDSEFDAASLGRLESHADRPEVVAALADGVGADERLSTSAGGERFYVAVRAPLGVARVSIPTSDLREAVDRARRDVLAAGAVALLVAALLSWLFSHAVTRPIVELRDVARAVAAGDLTRRPALSAPGEIGDLAIALHRMADQLGDRLSALEEDEALMMAVIESLHEGIVAVDPRREVVRINQSGRRLLDVRAPLPFSVDLLPRDPQLREALDSALAGEGAPSAELRVGGRTLLLTARPLPRGGAVLALLDLTDTRRLEAVRRDFVANVSHELKTPLTVVTGFADALADDDELEDAQRKQFTETIRVNARRMQRIVDDLLDLSRIESGRWVPAPAWTEVRAAAEEACAAASAAAERRGVRVEMAIAPDAATVWADPTALRQILSNLAENAARYTTEGTITIVARRDARGGTWVGVRDTGIGIPPEHLPRIFERFYRVDPGRSREAGGTGLGLSIVRHLAEAHGGRVRAESAPGRGTTIEALFPPAPRDAEE